VKLNLQLLSHVYDEKKKKENFLGQFLYFLKSFEKNSSSHFFMFARHEEKNF